MLNLIKMDLYRMAMSKSSRHKVYILVIINLIINILIGVAIGNSEFAQGIRNIFGTHFLANGICNFMDSGLLIIPWYINLVFFIVFTATFTNGKYKTGYIKNIQQFIDKKYKLVISETIVSFVYLLIIALISVIIPLITSCTLFIPDSRLSLGNMAQTFAGSVFIIMAIGMIIIAVTEIARKHTMIIVVSIIEIFSLHNFIVALMDVKVPGWSDYLPVSAFNNMTSFIGAPAIDSKAYATAMIVGLVCFVVSAAAGMIAVSKKDF